MLLHERRQSSFIFHSHCFPTIYTELKVINGGKKILEAAEAKFYNNKIAECDKDSKAVSHVMKEILQQQKEVKLPFHSSANHLVDRFAHFFQDKVSNIRAGFPDMKTKDQLTIFHYSPSYRRNLSPSSLNPTWILVDSTTQHSLNIGLGIAQKQNSSVPLTNLDKHGVVILVLLDLGASFDTVDHSVLLDSMLSLQGIGGTVLRWFRSYLTGRT
ncbi:hypothetical protein LSH36_880g01008 [Paralvinella palmiformis]|uniref:Reverse transcriptase domain-containing protein n=1 Tax=Paralvinella palmiformis TaxID=53620 RepID=A0AAD9MU42_9ANNE|nr:hypothetical protein LSH36_880g01008 [Paralvinella palmiformis]